MLHPSIYSLLLSVAFFFLFYFLITSHLIRKRGGVGASAL